tara:strand:- start:1462 stop:2037 length:576 start_codon:yes stop_codon:yes gene_type:complete
MLDKYYSLVLYNGHVLVEEVGIMSDEKIVTSRCRISINVGEIEIELLGSKIEVDSKLLEIKEGEEWSAAMGKIREAKDNTDLKIDVINNYSSPNTSEQFEMFVERYDLKKGPDQVLAAIHYLKQIEKLDDVPPRKIEDLFVNAKLPVPKNLSLYLNRLKEKNFLDYEKGKPEKNRFLILTKDGRDYLDSKK